MSRSTPRRLHRTTGLVLLLTLIGATLSVLLTRSLVDQSEQRLADQQAGQGAFVLATLLGQTSAATDALAQAVTAQGQVSAEHFQAVATGILRPAAQGGLGARAAALIRRSDGTVLARAGQPLGPLGAPTLGVDTRAALDGHALALLPLARSGDRRALVFVAPAGPADAVYLELGLDTDVTSIPALPGKAFSNVDFALYLGRETPADLVMSNRAVLPLTGRRGVARAAVTFDDAFRSTATPTQAPLLLVLHPRSPLAGTAAQAFPWFLCAFALAGGGAVSALLEASQRRRDQALLLVAELEQRSAEVERAVQLQAQTEQQLRQAQRLEAVGQLAGGIAHDFNNLLAVMFSYLGFLRAEGAGQPWLADVDEVDRAARRGSELVRQLVMFSRREPARQHVLDLRGLLLERHSLLQRTLRDDIDVDVVTPPGPVLVRADPIELDQVIMNLAVNARDAMPHGGRLVMTLDEVPGASGEQARLRVRDSGTGMDAHTRERAFEPFFTTKDIGQGTGLGLATVYGIVTRAGGQVELSSSARGTTVTVLLPTTTAELPVTDTAQPERPDGRGVARVLLVEDQPAVRRASARILREAGYDVVEAASGPEALRLFTTGHLDLLVSDVVMPGGLSGPDLAAALRDERPDLPVVLASGYVGDRLTGVGDLPPHTTVLSKPFDATALLDAVRVSLDTEGALP